MNILIFVAEICLIQIVLAQRRSYIVYSPKHGPELFKGFVNKYKKVYEDEAEYKRREKIFTENLKEINKRNKQSDSAVFGITQFSDRTKEELLGSLRPMVTRRAMDSNKTQKEYLELIDDEVPSEWDWRKLKVGTGIGINQDSCGACFAYCTVTLLESRFRMKHKKKVRLSQQQILDCSGPENGCDGGMPDEALAAIKEFGGAVSRCSYPYTATSSQSCMAKKTEIKAKVKSHNLVKASDEEILKYVVYKRGPLVAAMNVGPSFYNYKSGVALPEEIDCWPEKDINHCINIMGYGVDANGTSYWIIKNSYGRSWGERGYIKLIRGQAACKILEYIVDAEVY